MSRIYILIFLLVSLKGNCNSLVNCDTLSHWKVYRNSELIKQGIINGKIERIELYKKTIKVLDTLDVKYFEDTRCSNCGSKFLIRTQSGKLIKTLPSNNDYFLRLKTTELQMMAFKNKVSILQLYFKEDENSKPILLFEFEIK